MKTKSILLLISILLIGLNQATAQSKSDLENELKAANATIDSINLRLTSLETMYTLAKDSLVGTDFDPTKFDSITHARNAQPDSVVVLLTAQNKALSDSITTLTNVNDSLNHTIDNCLSWINAVSETTVTRADLENGLDAIHTEIVKQLGQLKELLDEGVLTQEEFDAKKKLLMQKW